MREVEGLCKLGVLERQPASEWASPSFIIQKKDRAVCFLSDFWEVNKRLVRTPLPIPKISTVLQEIEGFTFATALDLNMGYYTIRLDPDASKICITIFPWGKYSPKQLPMGMAGSPDIFQGKMSELMVSWAMVLAGKLSQLKWRNLLKASCWSKWQRSALVIIATQIVMALKSKYVDATY